MITQIQAATLKALCQRYHPHRLSKYRNWRGASAAADYHLGLLKIRAAPPRYRILDLGGGLSYLAAACRQLGHDATTLDLDDELPRLAAKALGVPYVGWMIVAFTSLPVTGPFDLITAVRLNMTEPDRWGWPEYEWFADHILGLLSQGGRWYMNPNRGENVAFVLDVARWQEILGDRAEVYSPTLYSIVIKKAER